MTFKTVNGLGREHYAKRALEVAMNKALAPSFVDAWVKWFDNTPADTSTPEYHADDLEVVAHAVLGRVEKLVCGVVSQAFGPDTELFPQLKEVFVVVAQQLAVPGCVEGFVSCE